MRTAFDNTELENVFLQTLPSLYRHGIDCEYCGEISRHKQQKADYILNYDFMEESNEKIISNTISISHVLICFCRMCTRTNSG